ncbi:MAG: YdcF family protein [Clostridia bacterium]|nr:YdcF family protein [Clostridia bacterium]
MKKKLKITLLYILLIGIILLMLGGIVNVFMMAWAQRYMVAHDKIDMLPSDFTPDLIMVLGAKAIDDNTMSKILTDRVDVGLKAFWHYDGEIPLLLSGADTPGQNEVNAMSVYVNAAGVSDNLILTDGDGLNTYASVFRSKEQFGAKKILIVTQDFHLPRSLYIARSLGIEAYGVSSDLHKYFKRNYIREYFARIKDFLYVMSA